MIESIEKSLSKIQPVNGYLFPVVIVDQNSDHTKSDRAVWVSESDEVYQVSFTATGWVAEELEAYIRKQLRSDGFEVSNKELTVPKIGESKDATSQESKHVSVQDGVDNRNRRNSNRSRRRD